MPRNKINSPRAGTAAFWASTNPTMELAEFAYESDTGRTKHGVDHDVTHYNSIPYDKTHIDCCAPGTTITVYWTGAQWEYPVGTAITGRPTSRGDVVIQFVDPIGTAPVPTFSVPGVDLLVQAAL